MYCADDTTFGACNKDLNSLINRFMKIKKQDNCLLLNSVFKYENVFGGTNWRRKHLGNLKIETVRCRN